MVAPGVLVKPLSDASRALVTDMLAETARRYRRAVMAARGFIHQGVLSGPGCPAPTFDELRLEIERANGELCDAALRFAEMVEQVEGELPS